MSQSLDTLNTSTVSFTMIYLITGTSYVEIPTAKHIRSLEDVYECLVTNVPLSLYHPFAFLSLEFVNDWLTAIGMQYIRECRSRQPDRTLLCLKESVTTLLRKLIGDVDQKRAIFAIGEIAEMEFQIIRVDQRDETKPGLYVEVSDGSEVAHDAKYWADTGDDAVSVIGHVSIQTFETLLLPEVRILLEEVDHGEPENLEDFVEEAVLNITNNLFGLPR